MCKQPKKIKDRAPANLLAGRDSVPRGGMGRRREEKADTDFVDRAPCLLGRKINAHAEGFEHICRAEEEPAQTMAMLAAGRARGGSHNGSRCRNIEGAGAIAARTAGIDHV